MSIDYSAILHKVDESWTRDRSSLRRVVLLMSCVLLARVIVQIVLNLLHVHQADIFFSQSDVFADSLKSGLAQRSVSAPLLTDPRVQSWPRLFQHYLFHNPYVGGEFSTRHSPPLATLQLMGIAYLIRLTSPTIAIVVIIAGYALAAAASAAAMTRFEGRARGWVAALLVLSYPALWMIDRGNFHSGLTSLFAVVYIYSACTRSLRVYGLIAISLAINLRPNVAVLLLLEFLDSGLIAGALRVALASTLSVLVFLSADLIANGIDASYSLAAFLHAVSIYNGLYTTTEFGLGWNASLFGGIRSVAHLLHIDGFNAHGAIIALSIGGLAFVTATFWLMVTRRITRLEGAFLTVASTVLFTPIYAQYHVLLIIAPLVIAALDEGLGSVDLSRPVDALVGVATLTASCLAARLHPNVVTVALPIVCAVTIPFAIRRRSAAGETTSAVIVTCCILALCPLGEELSHGIAVSLLLLASSAIVFQDCLSRRRPAPSLRNA